jgi:hypothetical protein
MRDAVLTGLALAAAALFKFTAVPFTALVVLVVIGLNRETWTRRLLYLVVSALMVVTCFAVPLGYLALRKRDFFNIALGWIGGGSAAENGAAANLARLWTVLTGFGNLMWLVVMLIGLGALVVYGRRRGAILLATLLIPVASIVLLGSEVLPRHYIVALPLALVLGGTGVALAVERLMAPRMRWLMVGFAAALVAALFPAFALQAYRDPGNLPLPLPVRAQYITDHSSGYGLREAVLDFPNTLTNPDIPIIASMFPDSCHRANFYVRNGRELTCTQVPGRTEIEAVLSAYGEVYVLTDNAPSIGIDVATLDSQAQQIAAYARPGETEASVVLWRLRRSED